MWCTCKSKGKTESGYTRPPDSGLWVCGKCLQPTRLVFEWITSMRAPKNATAVLGSKGKANGIWHVEFATTTGERKTVLYFLPYPKRPEMEKTNPGALLESVWAALDAKMDIIMAGEPDPWSHEQMEAHKTWVRTKNEARGIAETLAILMDPFFTDPNEVAKEAARRYKARQAGDDSYETPGLASEIWEPKSPLKDETIRKATTPRKAIGKPLPPEAVAGAKKALESGKFTVSQIAQMYGVSDEAVKSAVGS